jgi:hypothetical protein
MLLPVSFIAAGPIDPKTVPTDSDWYFHVNLDQLSNGKIGDWMMEMSDMMLFETGEESPLNFFTDDGVKISGGITLYGSGREPEKSIIRASGLKDQKDLLDEITKSKAYEKTAAGEFTIHSWVEEAKGETRVYGAFLDDDTMIASTSRETLGDALDFETNDKKGIAAPKNAGSAIVGMVNLEAVAKEAEAQMFRRAKRVESAMNVAADGSISGSLRLDTGDAESAEKMFMMIDGMIAFGSGYAEEGGWNPGDNMKASKNGNTVEIEMKLPISELEKLKGQMEKMEIKGVDA